MEERVVVEEVATVPRRGGRRGRFTAEQLAEIFVDLCRANVTAGQVMKKWGLHASELARIRRRGQAILEAGFGERARRGASSDEDPERDALQEEKRQLETALAQQTIELQLLKKKTGSDWSVPSAGKRSGRK